MFLPGQNGPRSQPGQPGPGGQPGPSGPAGPAGQPSCAADAVAMARAALSWLAAADVGSLPTGVQADCLRELEHITAVQTATRASLLQAFTAQAGYQADGHGSVKAWVRWQCRITSGAATTALGWARRLAAHPAVHRALATAQVSESLARAICRWTDELPKALRGEADAILLAAAAGGAELADLAGLAAEMRRRSAGPDQDGDGFDDRWVRLEETYRGAGSLAGELTPQCQAALRAVLDSLGKKAGPEDIRTRAQRDHDALLEACRRLVGSGCLPDRAGQPVQIQLSMTLDQLRRQDHAENAGTTRAAAQDGSTAGTGSGTAAGTTSGTRAAGPWPAAGPGDDCDAAIVPIVTGHIDHDLLDQLAAALASRNAPATRPGSSGGNGTPASPHNPGIPGHADSRRAAARQERAQSAARQLLVQWAADVLSGPGGLASFLRTRHIDGLVASVSLPLDVGAVTETIPVHLRRAVIARDRRCRFPGCDQPAAASQVHHIVPRSEGGPTCLSNLILLCPFHHLVVVHRWGWQIALHPDGTVTAISPDRSRILTDHGPPPATAA